jgi:PAS domain S-box-containing protein
MGADGFQTVFERAAVGLASITPQGNWEKVNQALCAMLGYAPEELIGQPLRELSHPEERGADQERLARLLSGQEQLYDREARMRRKDGSYLWVHFSVTPESGADGKPLRFVAVAQDIDERRRHYEASMLLAALVESSDDAIIAVDMEGRVKSWNEGAHRILGYSAEEMVGEPITRIIPADRAEDEPKIFERVRRGQKVDHYETVRQDKQGRLIDVSLTVSPIFDRNGRIIGASKISRDISQQKRVEQTLRDADRHKDEFLAVLAHELRNSLAPVRNALQISWLSRDRKVVEDANALIERQLRHMVHLVDDMLDVSRIAQGKLELRRESVDLAGALRNAVAASRPLIDKRNQSLEARLPAEGAMIAQADATRLVQVFQNLLTNASKYTPEGGHIVLEASAQAGKHGQEARVTVRDNGIGIAPDLLPSLFTLYTQSTRARDFAQGGLGIGLHLVDRLVRLHGGSVEAESAGTNQGSVFTVHLPLERRAGPVVDAPAGEEAALAGRRILIVDDNVDAADSMAVLLELKGHECQTVYEGHGVLAVARAFQPDVVLLDLGLPGLSGFEVARQLRCELEGEVPVMIAVTGQGQPEDRERAHEAGFDHHLLKPVDMRTLDRLLAGVNVKELATPRVLSS